MKRLFQVITAFLIFSFLWAGVLLAPSVARYKSIIRENNPHLSKQQIATYDRALHRADRVMDGISGEVLALAIAEKTSYRNHYPGNGIGITGLRLSEFKVINTSLTRQEILNSPGEAIVYASRYLRWRHSRYGSWTASISDFLDHNYGAMYQVLDNYYQSPDLLTNQNDHFESRASLYEHVIRKLYQSRGFRASSCAEGHYTTDPGHAARTILKVAKQEQVPPDLVFSVAWKETNVRCITGDVNLKYYAYGIMQVQRRTARSMLNKNVDPTTLRTDLETNVRAGSRYLKYWENRHDNYTSAIYYYNGGSMPYTHKVLARWAWIQQNLNPSSVDIAFKP